MKYVRNFLAASAFIIGIASLARAAEPAKAGPLSPGDPVELSYGGKWNPGTVTAAQGLTYFVHWGEGAYEGKFDRFYHLFELRKPGEEKTLAETWHDKIPDPAGGPIALGETVEAEIRGWIPVRVTRRLGDLYVVFPESPTHRLTGAEAWLSLAALRPAGSPKTYAQLTGAKDAKPPTPDKADQIKIGDRVEAYKRGGYGWFQATVMAIDGGRYYVQAGADSAVKGWETLVHMRPIGSKQRFEAEALDQFVGNWRLKGDAFFTTVKSVNKGDHVEKTQQLNSGAGQDAGRVKINADGTYVLANTVVYRDNAPGKWQRNPDQDEGGILLKEGQSDGKDLVVTPHPNASIYLQGALRGPGKIGMRE